VDFRKGGNYTNHFNNNEDKTGKKKEKKKRKETVWLRWMNT
jgi:hypothetical protein